jgi:hypothetical protein
MVYMAGMAGLIDALYIALAIALVWKYTRTHDAGFLWLGAALVLYPLAAALLGHETRVLIDRTIHGQSVVYPFSLVERGQMPLGSLMFILGGVGQMIRLGLFFVAVLYLCRTSGARALRPAH